MEMLVQAHKSISKVFSSEPLFIVEDGDLLEELNVFKINSVGLSSDGNLSRPMAELKHDVVFVISDRDIDDMGMLGRLLDGRNVLQIPTHAFDGGHEATKYTLEMCASLDIQDCVERNSAVLAQIASDRRHFSLESHRSTVTFSLFEEVRIMETASEQFLTDGSERALSTYTEVAFIPNVLDAREVQPSLLGYDVSGTFECEGCLVAIHMGIETEIVERHEKLTALVADLHANDEFPLSVTLENTQVKSIRTKSGDDVSEAFLVQMHGHLGENILELALGTNAGANRDTLDWRFNSPINESALGFHVAIGDGKICPHVDFICACPDAYSSFFEDGA